MTQQQYTDIISCYKALVANTLDLKSVKQKHLSAVLEKDRLSIENLPTSDTDEYIAELEILLQK